MVRSKPVIFLGPSISREKARKILDADYRLPAKKGDILQLILKEVDIVGLIDGYFLQDYPPTPIEVYNLVRKRNVKVFGSSSLGALRAVELGKYGMIGIGKIYRLFRDGILESDDEVAVTFTDYTNYKSEALIDIRYNLFLAQKYKIIDNMTRRSILRISKQTYFPYRTYEDILDKCKSKYPEIHSQLESFREYILNNKKSLKERDAVRLLKHIKNIYEP
ncbi:TfuA-like protein [Candidatus Nitrosocosmicus arcticus]|uniref:TfuA domain-containing protein n=1 Tax=Candidatus Nitrosocosmicus arcticus TaxID=2035267 RepID=A0A557SS10_9ARCH|nr:TfuA-like protein [Candidatus Nitrosocosmicus arcticus]TVP39403.1 TfuA domain-containing protein [Candidatus Nitrosocosmicus arcticus]